MKSTLTLEVTNHLTAELHAEYCNRFTVDLLALAEAIGNRASVGLSEPLLAA